MSGRLVLVGAGHAHLFVLEGLARGTVRCGSVTLVSPVPEHAYSGMVPGLIAGRYARDELEFDLSRLAARLKLDLVLGAATRLDPARREVHVAGQGALNYDVLSVAIGSQPAGVDLLGVREYALLVKPIQAAVEVAPALERAARAAGGVPRVLVVGAGAAGLEVALAARARLALAGAPQAAITVADAGTELLPHSAPATRRLVERALAQHAVDVRLGHVATAATREGVDFANGARVGCDVLIWATGAQAPALLRDSGLMTDARGFLVVDDALRAVDHPEVFAAGDAAAQRSHPATPKAGVYAVRQGPILRDNIAATLDGRAHAVRTYTPQPRFLALLNTGDGAAVLSYGPFAARGRWVLRLKERIDRAFMRRFQALAQSG